MPHRKKTLYPTLDDPDLVIEEAIAKLPISTRNELNAILQTYVNTLIECGCDPDNAGTALPEKPPNATHH